LTLRLRVFVWDLDELFQASRVVFGGLCRDF